jgi:hypothetical protein
MVQDPELTKAVAGIPQRSEKQSDVQKLVGAFVDVGILPQVDNINSQIIYGRRGTGKTHVMKVLASTLSAREKTAVIYVDARTLGSTNQFSDATVPLPARCTALFRDILNEIYNGLLEFVVNVAPEGSDAALADLDLLSASGSESEIVPASLSDKRTTKDASKSGASLAASAKGPEVRVGSSAEETTEAETTTNYVSQQASKIVFPAVSTPLRRVLEKCNSQLYVLIDEWSSIPMDVQPYLAEFLRRSLLPLNNVAIKIASLEYRSDFSINNQNAVIGFEMGADISAFLDIDDYYVYDRNPDAITDSFGDMLVKHLANELPAGYLASLGINDGKGLASKLFTERKVFQELVRASEGVARDLINIFSKAYFVAHRKGRDKIERNAVLEAARQWFEQDKERNLDDELRAVLRRITDEVIGNRRARSFLLPRELSTHRLIHRLFDLRVLHLVQRGYADKDKPGVRYNIYTLDYGTYVDLMNTTRRPEAGFEFAESADDPSEYIVPFDDKRSIRRIILTKDYLPD